MSPPYNPQKTREELLGAAFHEIWEKGFRAASMDAILSKTGVTKGALYHHFKNKSELGYAVMTELVGAYFHKTWVEPLNASSDPVSDLRAAFDRMRDGMEAEVLRKGCPLNNLAQEMSCIDDGFRERIHAVYSAWQDAIAGALTRGQSEGTVSKGIDPDQAALFLIAAFQGGVGLLKTDGRPETRAALYQGLMNYVETLRPKECQGP